MAEDENKSLLDKRLSPPEGGFLPWLVAPTNKGELENLTYNLTALLHEMFVKFQIISAEMKARIRRPKSNSRWGSIMAAVRLDLRVYADFITKPWGVAGAGVMTIQKSVNLVLHRFMDLLAAADAKARQQNTGGKGFDFDR